METKEFLYRIVNIDLIEKQVLYVNKKIGDQFSFNVRTQSALDEKTGIVTTLICIKISDLETNERLAVFTCAFMIQVKDMVEMFGRDDEGNLKMPFELELQFKSIGVSTMRGIIFSELRGTYLHRAIMPVILVDTLKPEDGSLFDEYKK